VISVGKKGKCFDVPTYEIKWFVASEGWLDERHWHCPENQILCDQK
jgi:hypothetical protein